jgi:hypothetical protein
VPPRQAGDGAEGDGRKVGDGPVQQDGGGHLRAGPVAGVGGQGRFPEPRAASRPGNGTVTDGGTAVAVMLAGRC